MEIKREKYLPVGSVVLLNNATKKLVVAGFCVLSDEYEGKIYDYCGYPYPMGAIQSNQIALFNHDQIKEIFFVGYEDEEEKKFKKSLNEAIKSATPPQKN